ncbi:hypothetical protein PGT21_004529 [Puccinia graminis f. sp. tritici]|uniref:Hydrophobin n=1 Tax=Puccinia graminis f. sp. tritici TaxID=56615 RepID=A0A5B0M3G9_PUCGR|nr:hypothetical protein PGTUg99_010127 [Puccinia graminis f. sp. tritici]KAA1099354.1 hypothetical protein PGT21_004529 [Puccinia graminis f. sp. tritici]
MNASQFKSPEPTGRVAKRASELTTVLWLATFSSIKANTLTDHPSSSSAKMRFVTLFQCLVVALIQGAFVRSVSTCQSGQFTMCETTSKTEHTLTEAKHGVCPPDITKVKCCANNNTGTFASRELLNRLCNGV